MSKLSQFCRRRLSTRMSIWLLLVWLGLIRDFAPLTWIFGLILAIGIQLLFPMPKVGAWRTFRPHYALILLVSFLKDLIVAAWQVSKIVLRRTKPAPIAVSVQLFSSSELYLTMVTAMTCLIPGSIVVRAQLAPSRILLHVLDGKTSGGAEGVAKQVHRLEMQILQALATREQLESARASRKRYLEHLRILPTEAEAWSPTGSPLSPEKSPSIASKQIES